MSPDRPSPLAGSIPELVEDARRTRVGRERRGCRSATRRRPACRPAAGRGEPRARPGRGSARAGRRTTTSRHRTSRPRTAARRRTPRPIEAPRDRRRRARHRPGRRPRRHPGRRIDADDRDAGPASDGRRAPAGRSRCRCPAASDAATRPARPIQQPVDRRGQDGRPPACVARRHPVVAFGLVGHPRIVPRPRRRVAPAPDRGAR